MSAAISAALPVALLALPLLWIGSAHAESQTYDGIGARTNNPDAAFMTRDSRPADYIVPKSVNVSLAPSGNSAKEVGLRFTAPETVNGCWDISPIQYTHGMVAPHYFDVTLTHYTRNQGACSGVNRTASATVPIEKKLLDEGKIKVLRLTIGATTDRYTVDYNKGRLEILPLSQAIFKTAGTLTHNFGRSGTGKNRLIALIVPAAPKGTDTHQAIADFAGMRGLTPAPESATSSLPHTNGGTSVYYYYDSGKQLGDQVGSEFSPVGSTTLPLTYDLPDGRGQDFAGAPVYAKAID